LVKFVFFSAVNLVKKSHKFEDMGFLIFLASLRHADITKNFIPFQFGIVANM